MKLVCIDMMDYVNLTIGKTYYILDEYEAFNGECSGSFVDVECDEGKTRRYYRKMFITEREFRNRKFKELLE